MAADVYSKDNKNKAHCSERNDQALIDYLLAEYNDAAENWRFHDSRTEAAVNFYLTFMAALLAGAVVVYSSPVATLIVVVATVIGAGLLFAVGYFLRRRVTNSAINRARHLVAKQLVRRYFVDNYPGVAPYIYFAPVMPLTDVNDFHLTVRPTFARQLTLAVDIVSGLALGVMGAGIVWLLYGQSLSIYVVVFTGLGISLLSASLLVSLSLRTWGQFEPPPRLWLEK